MTGMNSLVPEAALNVHAAEARKQVLLLAEY
jgi:hypothetical protein